MYFQSERARTQTVEPLQAARAAFGLSGPADAVFLTGRRDKVFAVTGLPFPAPVCAHLINDAVVADWLAGQAGDVLLDIENLDAPAPVAAAIHDVCHRVLSSPGQLNDKGELLLDLKSYPVGLHYPINLLLGDRTGYPYPLVTTPKSVLDAFGRGSFRASGQEQVLATRYVLAPEENGEPANRQFYLIEGGRQIFYSLDVATNVASAECRHSQNHTVITYVTEDGLTVRRTIFLLPQEEGMPGAVEAQRVEITNNGAAARSLRFIGTGVFGIAQPGTVAQDIVYANLVQESELLYLDGHPACLSLHAKPAAEEGKHRFAMLLVNGEFMDGFETDQAAFIGTGTLARPEMIRRLSNRYSRKMASFFALAKELTIAPGETACVDEFVGMADRTNPGAKDPAFDTCIRNLYEKYKRPEALAETLDRVKASFRAYAGYLTAETGNRDFDAYVNGNLPFQVLYQTFVSRAFAWTQKSYREIGFREIQDLFASMYYLHAAGRDAQVRTLLGNWISKVFRMGYAYHNFTWRGKEPGMCSDDALWLVQAVYRYVTMSGDVDFLREAFPVAGTDGATRPLMETLHEILMYSGKISVGAHGLPLLDVADWNDTLRLDKEVLQGPEKEARYREQLRESGDPYGVPFESEGCESVMNACLLKIAADETAELAAMLGQDTTFAEEIAAATADRVQRFAWKDDYFARCLINDSRPYTYLGAAGDGLSLDPATDGSYFLNSFSWAVLAGIAAEDQIAKMIDVLERHLRTDAGFKLCTLVDFDKLGVETGTAYYFPGDRENCGVFKHAQMMAAVACLRAAKSVKSADLAERLRALAFFMIDKTLPYGTMQDPFTLKGNPRFCTQYNNSETGENIGPMLSGTASWLTLAMYESFGFAIRNGEVRFAPVLRPGEEELHYAVRIGAAVLRVTVTGSRDRFRLSGTSKCAMDGVPFVGAVPLPAAGEHRVTIEL